MSFNLAEGQYFRNIKLRFERAGNPYVSGMSLLEDLYAVLLMSPEPATRRFSDLSEGSAFLYGVLVVEALKEIRGNANS